MGSKLEKKLVVATCSPLLRPPALQYSQLWYPFPAPGTLRGSGTRDPNLEDRFRVRSHVIGRPYWYCRSAALFTPNDAIVNTPSTLAVAQWKMTEILSGGPEKAGCSTALLWFKGIPSKLKQVFRLTNGRLFNMLQDANTRNDKKKTL